MSSLNGESKRKRPDLSERNRLNAIHGKTNTSAFKVWIKMKKRCFNQKDKDYPRYGVRGITVCDRWLSFENFFLDMGERPSGLQLDRINNEGNYEPNNCRWVTPKENSNNRRSNVSIEYEGIKKTYTQWATEIGICSKTLMHRIKSGWSIESALKTKVKRRIFNEHNE